ncbi:MAG: glycosyltransferase, partial [Blautia sp.]|nr:glycosyltransferase [Blautia sp.]
ASEYEGFPVAAIESMASGIPVISTPVDGIVELIKPGINGFLFPQGDSTALADILNAISSGKLPSIRPETCRETVADYEEQKVCTEFSEAIMAVLDKISVIIPCYNVEKQVARCLDSILDQTLHGVDMEIICIDDRSTDRTLQILEEYEKDFSEKIMLIPLDENGKQGNARNIGMMYASGNYITFVDADDVIAPRMLQALYDQAAVNQCEIVECAYKEVFSDNDVLSVEKKGNWEYMRSVADRKKYILQYGWRTGPWARLYRRDFLESNQISFPKDTYMEDIYFSELCMLNMNSYIRVPYTYYFYCINPSGVMYGEHISDYYMDTAKVQNMTTRFVLDCGLASDCMQEYAFLHFSKAFAEPVARMCRDKSFFSYDNFHYLKKALLQLFPDLLQNPYVKNDNSAEMELYRLLLQETYPEEELYKIICLS